MGTNEKVAELVKAGVAIETYGSTAYVTIAGVRHPASKCCDHAGCGELGTVRVSAYAFCPRHAAVVGGAAVSARHTHRMSRSRDRGFSGPVRQPENRAAHGGICVIDTCACGATRHTNRNGLHVERGAWREREENEVQS